MFSKILLCSDGSERSLQASVSAANLAKLTGGALTLLHVCKLPELDEPFAGAPMLPSAALDAYTASRHASVVQRTLSRMKDSGVRCEIIEETGDPVEVILRTADHQGFDTIVIGSRGLKGEKSSELGSVSSQVVQRSHATVVVVK